jgi:hypothetical protein
MRRSGSAHDRTAIVARYGSPAVARYRTSVMVPEGSLELGDKSSIPLKDSETSIRELTIHIGLPKTATTTLQRHVFPMFSGYVGKHIEGSLHEHVAAREEMWRRAFAAWEVASPAWREELRDALSRISRLGEDRVLLSEERFSWWPLQGFPHRMLLLDGWSVSPRVGRHPVMELLAETQEYLGAEWRVRAILTLRNQPDFLGALYAEQQRAMSAPSQKDFEGKVREALRIADPWLDYDTLVEDLHATLEPDDVLTLLYEDGIAINVSRIADFLGVEFDDVLASDTPRENARRAGEGSWQGFYRLPPITKRGAVGRLRRRIDNGWPDILGRFELPLKRLLATVDGAVARIVRPGSSAGVLVTMHDELKAEVHRHCSDSNARLADRLGRDIASHGY